MKACATIIPREPENYVFLMQRLAQCIQLASLSYDCDPVFHYSSIPQSDKTPKDINENATPKIKLNPEGEKDPLILPPLRPTNNTLVECCHRFISRSNLHLPVIRLCRFTPLIRAHRDCSLAPNHTPGAAKQVVQRGL